jgi:NADH:ubiquinone oxidoreductase subunit 6 (subunit J)
MNDPIVSPWLVYWLGRLDCFVEFSAAIAMFSFVGAVFLALISIIEVDEGDRQAFLRRWWWVFVVPVISVAVAVFTPTKSDLIGMYVASKTTPANIEKAVDAGKAIKDELLADVLAVIEAAAEDK